MTPDPRDMQQRLDAFLDGLLSGAEADEMRRLLAENEQLRAAAESQARIDAGLRQAFTPPAAREVLARVLAARAAGKQAEEPRILRPFWASRAFAAAAVILIAVAGGTSYYLWSASQAVFSGSSRYEVRELAQVYRDEVRSGFTPLWECRDVEVFRRTFVQRLGAPLAFVAVPSNAGVWGLSYAATPLSRDTIEILAKLDDTPIVVFVDKAERALPEMPAAPSGLRIFKQVSGPFVMYEITPLSEAKVLPLLKVE